MAVLRLKRDITDPGYHFPDNIIADSSFIQHLKQYTLDKVYYVTQNNQFRPDLIAKELYKNEQYDWVVLLLNGLTKSELKPGTKILYVSLTKLTEILSQ